MNSRLKSLLMCLSLFLLTVLLWHIYRFLVEVSPFFPFLKWGTPLGYIFYLGFYLLMFATLAIFVKLVDRSSLHELGLRKATRWRVSVILGILFGLLARLLEAVLFSLVGGTLMLLSYPSPPIIGFFIVDTLIVGLAEEGVFRGYIQRHLTHIYGFVPALLASSVLFKVYHINFFKVATTDLALLVLGIAPLPSFGMFAGYLYHRSGENLFGPIVLHMFYDLFQTIIPLGVEIGSVPTWSASFLRILRWLTLMFALKILADRKVLM